MKTTNLFRRFAIPVILITGIAILAGCAAKKNTWGDPKTGMTLEYKMPDQKDLRYDQSTEYTQGMEVRGQTIDLTANSRNKFTMAPQGMKNGNYKLNVTIDTMFIEINSPRGKIEADMSNVIGKNFDFIVSSKGKELDYAGAKDLKYALGAQEELSIASNFQTVFPNLPEKPIKVGESWNSIDTLTEESGGGYLRIITHLTNNFEGIETYMGYDCIKIHTTYSGILEGSSETQGIELNTTGTITGNDTWYFAYKEGLFLKMISEGIANSMTLAKGDEEIEIPSTRDFGMVTELVSK